jgi:hypothetical protein
VSGGNPAEAVVGRLAVVALQPGLRQIADLDHRFTGVGVEHFRAVAAIETFVF